MLSKNTYNILLLYYIYSNLFIKLFLNFQRLNVKILFLKKKKKNKTKTKPLRYTLNTYIFFSNRWYIFYFTIFFLHPFSSNRPSSMTKSLYKQRVLNRKKMWI